MPPFAYKYVWQSGTSRGYMEFNHVSVLLEEVINSLQVKPSGCYIDCTVGGGGHSYHIAQQLDPKLGGRLWGIDQDECALLAASERLAPFGDTVHLVRDNFSNLASVASEHGIDQADGILLDLGVSSYQLDTPERGFSYIHNAPLDMRMDDRSALTASVIVNTYYFSFRRGAVCAKDRSTDMRDSCRRTDRNDLSARRYLPLGNSRTACSDLRQSREAYISGHTDRCQCRT